MPNELVTVATYPQTVAAHAAKNFLEENGIRAFIADEYVSALQYPAASTSVKLQVSVADAGRARELLDSASLAKN